MSFTTGENVGAYRIVAQLGQGGMATVFKAYHPGLDRYVAIKVLHPAFKEDPTFVQRFNREARIVARLEHPNIVPVYGYEEHKGLAYLVMKFVDGETLKARLKRGALRPEQIVDVARQVGAALSYAHRQGILHRDIKPSNILLTGRADDPDALGDIFLTDFGLARIAEAGESTMSRDMMMGTPQYISPEQAKGMQQLDDGTDIYSLGVVLFELVTGRVPFSADTPYSIIHDHIFSPLPLPTSIRPDIPERVERVLLKALAKERADRYPDVDSFVAAIAEAIEAGETIPAATGSPADEATTIRTPLSSSVDEVVLAGPPAEPVPPAKRKRGCLYAGIAAAVIILCLGSLMILGAWNDERNARATATAAAQVGVVRLEPLPDDPALAEKIRATEERVLADPNDPHARLDLAFLYAAAKALPEAHEQMRQAVGLKPQDEGIYLDIGRYLLEAGQDELALETFFAGLEVLPDSRPLQVEAARLLWHLGAPDANPKLAESVALELVEQHPDEALFHVFLARALISTGRMEEARKEIDRALELAPDLGEGHLVNGLWLRKDRKVVEARREFVRALELGLEDWLRQEVEREMEALPSQ